MINFPNSPTVGATHTVGSTTWVWNGTVWGPMNTPSFASSAENAAGTVENKAVDPLGIREAFNASGSAPVFACRAWVNFNGTGTVAIRASGNVSSITDNGVGNYTVNFTDAMSDANYATVTQGVNAAGTEAWPFAAITRLASSVRITNKPPGYGAEDAQEVSVAVFR